MFITARQLPQFSARWIQFTAFHPIHFNIISRLRVSSKWSHSFRFPHQNPTRISVLPNICHMPHPAHPIDNIILISGKRHNKEDPHYALFSGILLFPFSVENTFSSQYSNTLSLCSILTTIKNNRQYSTKILERKIAGIPRVWFSANFFMRVILSWYCSSQIFALCHNFKWLTSYLYVAILSWMLFRKYEYTYIFLILYFQTNLLTSE